MLTALLLKVWLPCKAVRNLSGFPTNICVWWPVQLSFWAVLLPFGSCCKLILSSCMSLEPSCEEVVRYHHHWSAVAVSTYLDSEHWHFWSARSCLLTTCVQLGSLQKNLQIYVFFTQQDVGSLRVSCFGWAVELFDISVEWQQVIDSQSALQ